MIRYVDDRRSLEDARSALSAADLLAVDCEAAGFHRYSDRLCLVQVTCGRRTYLFDPLALDPAPALEVPLRDPKVDVVMHGADFDLRLLDRDLGLKVRALFDTQVAASLLGIDGVGLGTLLEIRFGIRLSKKYQQGDWARRPLPGPMLEYAARDTAHLADLAGQLRTELFEAGRLEWALEEFRTLEAVRFERPPARDPVLQVREARNLGAREVDRLREALDWRDRIARQRDRAPFRVAGNRTLVEAAERNPGTVSELADVSGMNAVLARERGGELIRRFRSVDRRPTEMLTGYPYQAARRNGRRHRRRPEVERRLTRLKAVRNSTAARLGLDRGTLISNAVLEVIAEAAPSGRDELTGLRGVRRWQSDLLGAELLASV